MTEDLTIWEPKEFDGSDLLPLAPPSNDLEIVGDDDIDDGDTVVPVLKMLQGTAVNEVPGASAGQFYNTVTKELFDSPIRVLVIAHSKGNSFFVDDKDPAQKGLKDCWSPDGIEGTEYGLCSECGKNEWDRSTDPHTKPMCNKQHKIIVMTPSGPAMMRFQSTSYKALTGLLTAKKLQRKNFFDHPAHIIADGPHKGSKNGKTFTYYKTEVKWDTSEAVPLEIRKTALDTYKGLREAEAHGRLKGSDVGKDGKPSTDYTEVPF